MGKKKGNRRGEYGFCHSWRSAATGSHGERRGEKGVTEERGKGGIEGKRTKNVWHQSWDFTRKAPQNERVKR